VPSSVRTTGGVHYCGGVWPVSIWSPSGPQWLSMWLICVMGLGIPELIELSLDWNHFRKDSV